MRLFVVISLLALVACSPPSNGAQATTSSTAGRPSAPSAPASPAIAVQASQLGGQWSFDRSCGLYDLVFTNDAVSYYDYSDQSHVVSYDGLYTIAGNRIVITVRRLDAHGAPSGDAITYNFDITAPVNTDLVGHFGAAGGDVRDINAKQCPAEDRE